MIVHIAGFPVKVGQQSRQLCAWCGASLIDIDHRNVMVAPNADGTPGEGPHFWAIGVLVAVDGPASWVLEHEDGAQLPLEACASGPRSEGAGLRH
jgi:hypothetical protein